MVVVCERAAGLRSPPSSATVEITDAVYTALGEASPHVRRRRRRRRQRVYGAV